MKPSIPTAKKSGMKRAAVEDMVEQALRKFKENNQSQYDLTILTGLETENLNSDIIQLKSELENLKVRVLLYHTGQISRITSFVSIGDCENNQRAYGKAGE